MKPQHFVDIEVRGGEKGGDIPHPVLAGAMLRVLHGVFREYPGKFALALPRRHFSRLRVFAETREDLDLLVSSVRNHPAIRNYGQIGYPDSVPSDFAGPWKRYSRFRIPTRKADRTPNNRLRRSRMEKAEQKNIPFFPMISYTSGQRFSLHVDIQNVSGCLEECQPDSYGLSVASKPFALPDLS